MSISSSASSLRKSWELEAKSMGGNLRAEEVEDQRGHLLARLDNRLIDTKNAPSEILELAEVVTSHERLVILGDPGSGKSTLLRYLALKHAQALYTGRSKASSDLGDARFPILLRIADYAEHGMPHGKSLSNYLADYYDMHECPKFGLADLLANELAEGNCLVLLDGLDEIVGADERQKVIERIEDFIRYHDNRPNRFVLTSRIAGYRNAPLGDPFIHYTVQEMDETQIRRFLERWCTAVEEAQTPELSQEARNAVAHREIDGIMKAVRDSPGVHRLAANPLLLRTLALIHRTAQGVPESALVDEKYLTRLLGKLAYWLHENKPSGIATEREVYRELGQEWARIQGLVWEEDHPGIESEVEKFLRAVRVHTGLFVERAPKRYGFMHLTFEEYYAARYLVEALIDRLEYLKGSEGASALVQNLLAALHDAEADVRYVAAESLGRVAQASQEVIDVLLEALDQANWWFVRRNSARLLGKIGQNNEQINQALWRRLMDENDNVRVACAEALVQLGRRHPNTAEIIKKKSVQDTILLMMYCGYWWLAVRLKATRKKVLIFIRKDTPRSK